MEGPPPLPDFAAPLALPAAPVPIALRPTLTVTGGSIVYNAQGELISPPGDITVSNLLDPFGGVGRRIVPEHAEGTSRIHNLTLDHDQPVSITFIGEGAGHRNTLGYYKIGPDGEITDVRIIWPNASGARRADMLQAWQDAGASPEQIAAMRRAYGSSNEGGDLLSGLTTVELNNLQAGDSFGFFIVSNGFNNGAFAAAMRTEGTELSFRTASGEPAQITPGMTEAPRLHWRLPDQQGWSRVSNHTFHTAAHGDTLALNTSGHQQVIGGQVGTDLSALGIWGVDTGDLLIGFEDLARPGGDHDFNDVVFRLNVDPAFVERLETVSQMPTVRVDTRAAGQPVTGALIEVESLGGATLRLAGARLTPGAGTLDIQGQTVGYVLVMTEDGAQLSLSAPEGLSDATAGRLLSSLAFDGPDGTAAPLPAGDRSVRFSVATEASGSDLYATHVRVLHNTPGPPQSPPTTILETGRSNAEIAQLNADAEAAWQAESARIAEINAALAEAEAAVRTAHADALAAQAALAVPLAGLTEALASAETARARLVAEAADLGQAEASRAAAHAATVAAWEVLVTATAAEEATAAAVLTAQTHLSTLQATAETAAAEVAELLQTARAAVARADTARAGLADAEALAQAAAETANARLAKVEAAEHALGTVRGQAEAQLAQAEAATAALQSAEAALAVQAEAAVSAHAAHTAQQAEAQALAEALSAVAADVAATDSARRAAHARWSADPASAEARSAFETADAAHAEALATHGTAHAALLAQLPALEASEQALAAALAARSEAEALRDAGAEAQAAAAAGARSAAASLSEAQAMADAARLAHAEAVAAFDAAAGAHGTALSDAQERAAEANAATQAHAAARAAFLDGPGADHGVAVTALDAAIEAHSAAAADRMAALAQTDAALDTLAAAEAETAAVLTRAIEAADHAEAALTLLDGAQEAFSAARAVFSGTLTMLADAQAAYDDLLARSGLAEPGPSSPGFLDAPLGGGAAGDGLVLADLAPLSDGAGDRADASADLPHCDPLPHCDLPPTTEDPGLDGIG
ncbi:MAG: DUF4114 domain-containing protein [Alkalilacustris sp.]